MLWEELVTVGHFRAARLRHLQPFVYGSAVVMVIAGFALFLLFYHRTPSRPLAGIIQERMADERDLAYRGFRLLGEGNHYFEDNKRQGKAVKDAPTPAIMRQFVEANIASLQNSNKLATNPPIPQAKQSPEQFWIALWPLGEAGYMEGDDTFVVGAIVRLGNTDEGARIARWMGIFKKVDGTWQFASLKNREAMYVLEDFPVVDIGDLPLTIKPFIPPALLVKKTAS